MVRVDADDKLKSIANTEYFLVDVTDLSVSTKGSILSTITMVDDTVPFIDQPDGFFGFDTISLTTGCTKTGGNTGCGQSFEHPAPTTERLREEFLATECADELVDYVFGAGEMPREDAKWVELGEGGLRLECASASAEYFCEGRFEYSDTDGCDWEGLVISAPDMYYFALSARVVGGCDLATSQDLNDRYCRTGKTAIGPAELD